MKPILTLSTLLLLSTILIAQNLTKQELIDINRTRVERLMKNDVLLPLKRHDLREVGLFQLDSIISGSYDHDQGEFELVLFKDIFSYDDFGNTESAIFYYRFEGYYFPSQRMVFSFNEEGNITEQLLQDRNSFYSTWEDYYKWVYQYDTLGRISKERLYEFYYYDWELSEEKTYQYNSNNLLAGYIIERYGYYEEREKRAYTYDKSGNLISDTYYSWNNYYEVWEESDKTDYILNDENQLVAEISYRQTYNGLIFDMKDTLVYNEENVLTYVERFMYNDFESFWQPIFKENYEYGTGSKVPTSVISQVWTEEMEWKNAWEDDNLLDDNENVLSRTNYSIRSDSTLRPYHLFVFDRIDDITLNDLNSGSLYWLEDWVLYLLDDFELPKGPNAVSRYSEYYWNPYDEIWEYEYAFNESFLYYSAFSTTNTDEALVASNFQVYPNPVDRLLTVETDLTDVPFDLYLCNMYGQRLFRKNISANEQILLPDLPEGMYVLQMMKENRMLGSQKIIIRH
jgi:hypothetical protein